MIPHTVRNGRNTLHRAAFCCTNTPDIHDIALSVAKENGAELQVNELLAPNAEFVFLPIEREVACKTLTATSDVLAMCLPNHPRRDDVSEVEDLFVVLERAREKHVKKDSQTIKAKARAEKAENELLIESLKAALESGRLMWFGEESI